MTLRNLAKEPLVHFLFAGALLWLFFLWQGDPPDPASRSIDVGKNEQAQLALRFEQTMQRPPTDAELDALIEQYVREEVLYREALKLGLDADDAIVRRRLSQKMDMLAASSAESAVPSEDQLAAWLEEHPERFASDAVLSFDQRWFESENDANEALQSTRNNAEQQVLGGSLSLPPSVEGESLRNVRSQFGEQFVRGLGGTEVSDEWAGPIPSGFGWHLVRLRRKELGSVPPLEDIRQRVEDDWRSSTIAARKEEAYGVLREAYSIDIDR